MFIHGQEHGQVWLMGGSFIFVVRSLGRSGWVIERVSVRQSESEVGDVADGSETQCPGAQIQPNKSSRWICYPCVTHWFMDIHGFFALRQQPSMQWLLPVSWAYFDDAYSILFDYPISSYFQL